MDNVDSTSLHTTILQLSATLIACGVIYKYIILPFIRFFFEITKYLKTIATLVKDSDIISLHIVKDKLEIINNDINVIKQELTPNGGNSLKDTINHIKSQLKIQDSRYYINNNEELLWEANNKGEWVRVSHAMAELLSINKENISGNDWQNLILEDHRKEVNESWKYSLENSVPFKISFNDVHGRKITLIAQPILDINKKPLYWIGKAQASKVDCI